jgi:hypothetical protein
MSERYIVIPRWEEFQHYRDRDPVWVKVYTRLLSDDGFRDLTFHQRGVLVSLWIEYARSGRQLRDNTATLTRQLGGRVMTRDIEALTHAGFITFSASAPLAQSKNKRKNKNSSKDPSGERAETAERENPNGKPEGWIENLGSYTGCRYVRGEFALTAVRDVLGTERPPSNWPYARPTRFEIRDALKERAHA